MTTRKLITGIAVGAVVALFLIPKTRKLITDAVSNLTDSVKDMAGAASDMTDKAKDFATS